MSDHVVPAVPFGMAAQGLKALLDLSSDLHYDATESTDAAEKDRLAAASAKLRRIVLAQVEAMPEVFDLIIEDQPNAPVIDVTPPAPVEGETAYHYAARVAFGETDALVEAGPDVLAWIDPAKGQDQHPAWGPVAPDGYIAFIDDQDGTQVTSWDFALHFADAETNAFPELIGADWTWISPTPEVAGHWQEPAEPSLIG